MSRNLQAKPSPGQKQNRHAASAVFPGHLLDHLACGIIVIDAQQNILTLNQWMVNHSMLCPETAVGQNFLDLFPDMKNTQLDKSIEAALRYDIKSVLTPDINLTPLPLFEHHPSNIPQNNTKASLRHAINISPVAQPDQTTACLIQITKVANSSLKDSLFFEQSLRMMDETEALRQSQRSAEQANKAKSEFLALMSHELRTPLNAIIGFADILKNELLGPHAITQYKDYSHDISEAGNHLLNLINDILDISKIDAGKYALNEEIVDVHEVVRNTRSLIRNQISDNGQTLTIHYEDDLPDLKVDGRSLKQMVLNLLSNAIKFTPDGGTIDMKVKLNKNRDMVFSVVDNGIGIAPHEIPQLLQPFTQSESNMTRECQGTGLGLSLVKKMVELHGGTLHLASELGNGTTVTLTFPAERVIAV
ncbi:sensor histidine kinase [Paremcibacter congregatus]|uniref:sensor histidine kinase n=1 Tax=Paremcibacter congregatus TaxID=2043170 RepID=UPI0030ED3CF4